METGADWSTAAGGPGERAMVMTSVATSITSGADRERGPGGGCPFPSGRLHPG